MITSFSDLMQAKKALDEMKQQKPVLFRQFINIVQLTRQLQYRFQYMGSLIMGEDTATHEPAHQDAYVLSVYQQEIEKLQHVDEIKALLSGYKKLGYANISRLALGTNPNALVGPAIVR